MENKNSPKNNNAFPNDDQANVIDPGTPYIQDSFDLGRLDAFVAGLGVNFFHYKAMPSPIGQRDRGDYRRSDGVDTITSNGMIYKCAGVFRATMTDDTMEKKRGGAGFLDSSEARLVMPRFYNDKAVADGKTIYLLPGDRIYYADPNVDAKASNSHKMDYIDGQDNVPMFPIMELELPITDSRNIEYCENVDYCITQDGNIRWLPGGNNPGIDPMTGKGRVYTVRYLYKAYWYITALPKEVRITNISDDQGNRVPTRAAYHAIVQREFIYHNQNKGDKNNQNKPQTPKRAVQEPNDGVSPSKYEVPVDRGESVSEEENE